jgi:transcription-repair coupling factor (superfamily II helicase)
MMLLRAGHLPGRGDSIEIHPAYMEQAYRIELWGDTVERISRIDPLTGNTIAVLDQCAIYPAKHFVTQRATVERAVKAIRTELAERLHELKSAGKLLEAQRLESRTGFDIEMLLEVGTCAGIENYSRHLTGRLPGERPACLLDYFPADYLVVVEYTCRCRRSAGCSTATAREDYPRQWLPAAIRTRQPPPAVRGVHGAGAADDQRVGHAGGRTGLGWRHRGADHPADRPCRSRGGDPPGEGSGGRPPP